MIYIEQKPELTDNLQKRESHITQVLEYKPKVLTDTIRDKIRFQDLTKNLKVMARSQPIHKYALVLD